MKCDIKVLTREPFNERTRALIKNKFRENVGGIPSGVCLLPNNGFNDIYMSPSIAIQHGRGTGGDRDMNGNLEPG